MKYFSIAVLALLGKVSAERLNRHPSNNRLLQDRVMNEVSVDDYGFIVLGETIVLKKESEDLCDGDAADDKEIEDEWDPDDDVVDDTPYGHLWVQTNSETARESEELCDGDAADDKEVEDENDEEDDVVDDSGFVHKWVQLEDDVAPPENHNQILLYKYSDELANGDSADDRDIHEDEDMNDDVVDING